MVLAYLKAEKTNPPSLASWLCSFQLLALVPPFPQPSELVVVRHGGYHPVFAQVMIRDAPADIYVRDDRTLPFLVRPD